MKKTINYILSILMFITTGLGTSLSIKGAIGVSSFNSLNISLSYIIPLKIGTITLLTNLIFLILYIFITKNKYKLKYILQFIGITTIGLVINFFTYNIFEKIILTNYISNLLFLLLGIIIGSISVGVILTLDSITFPIEAFCYEYSIKNNKNFASTRRYIDYFSIIFSLIISYIFKKPLLIREGTLISLFCFSTIIEKTNNYLTNKKWIQKLKIYE